MQCQQSHFYRTVIFAILILATISGNNLALAVPQTLSDYVNGTLVPLAGGQPFPSNLLDASGPTPFTDITVGGNPTVAIDWDQTFSVVRTGSVPTPGNGPIETTIMVTETDSAFKLQEFSDGTIGTAATLADPIKSTKLVAGPALGSTLTLNILDADIGASGTQFFTNDLLTEVPVGEEIAVYQSGIVDLSIRDMSDQIIATAQMIGIELFSAGSNFGVVDNAFGVMVQPWVANTTEIDGVSSPFLLKWNQTLQTRWKPHPSGWRAVGTEVVTGPAGLLHDDDGDWVPIIIPEPGCIFMAVLGTLGFLSGRWHTQ